MKTYQTMGAEAEDELTLALGAEGRLYKAGILDSHTIVPVRLKSTYEESKRLLFERTVVRPAFKAEEDALDLPVLFFKADGGVEELIELTHAFRQQNNKTCLYHTSFHQLNAFHRKEAFKIGDMASDDALQHLQKSKKDLVLRAFDEIKTYAGEHYPEFDEDALYQALIPDNAKVLDALHHFSPQKTSPKIIVQTIQRDQLKPIGVLRLLFASKLCFDVCIISKDSYASIENDLEVDAYDHYVLEKNINTTKAGGGKALKYAAIGAAGVGGAAIILKLLGLLF